MSRVLFVDIAPLRKLHGKWPTALRDGRNGLNALNDGGIVHRRELSAVDANITPAASRHETTDSTESQTKRDRWRQAVGEIHEIHVAECAINQNCGDAQNKPAVKNEPIPFPNFERFKEGKFCVEKSRK